MTDFLIISIITLIPLVIIMIPLYLASSRQTALTSKIIGFVLLAGLTFLGFKIMEMGTLTPSQRLSNGNPMILFIPVTIICALALFYALIAASYRRFISRQNLATSLVIILSALLIEIYIGLELKSHIDSILMQLGGGTNTPASLIHNKVWFNAYTYSAFFNLYSFLLLILSGVQLGVLIPFLTRLLVKKERTQS